VFWCNPTGSHVTDMRSSRFAHTLSFGVCNEPVDPYYLTRRPSPSTALIDVCL